ncbi:hypothetical protein M378DRAFT_73403 [Amanita muscaria Koide BX008]|uniref:Peptidase M48 domain-containing protein n=1 Tax=Amanita muscaria (strain Koide BX008) TaxID=946122 RepID=A0A0C2XFG5_AMAMK|nr:hypothetical protein M378DRAFT_73403 [Amanita muscaria Koide BX008]
MGTPGRITTAKFHSTARRDSLPLIPLIASVLKASAALELTRTAGRIAMTFIPVILIKNYKSRMRIKHAALHGLPASEEKINTHLKRIRARTLLVNFLFLIPFTLFWATIIASLEQTPALLRWMLLVIYRSYCTIRATGTVNPGYFQSAQFYCTFRALCTRMAIFLATVTTSSAMATWQFNIKYCPSHIDTGHVQRRLFPFHARKQGVSRNRTFLHRMCETVTDMSKGKQQHRKSLNPSSFEGPPYSLLLVDRPDAPNALSYGFGPDGGGGIVVYSGFLDEIFSKHPIQYEQPRADQNQSWWSQIVKQLFLSSSPPPPKPKPTPEQTTELAILLAHELAHLILSHHLETLSSATIVVPGVLSIASDVIRILVFPMTMLFGPFVNDAVAQLGKVGSGELLKLGEHCTSWKQEIEADVVSTRLLAHAGFDAREALKFWEDRSQVECSPTRDSQGQLIFGIRGDSHPLNETRITKIKEELERWEKSRLVTLAQRHSAKASGTS